MNNFKSRLFFHDYFSFTFINIYLQSIIIFSKDDVVDLLSAGLNGNALG